MVTTFHLIRHRRTTGTRSTARPVSTGSSQLEEVEEAFEDTARRWLALGASSSDASDLDDLDIPYCSHLPSADPELIEAIVRNKPDLVGSLVASGADTNTETSNGNPLLFEVVWRDRTEIARILVDAGADVNAKTAHGISLLSAAIWWKRTDTCKFLLMRALKN